MSSTIHVPVLRDSVIEYLRPRRGGVYVDATIGLGGHAEAILDESDPDGRVIGLDRDADALALAGERLARFRHRVVLIHSAFADLPTVLALRGQTAVDGVLMDLGMSSFQLDQSGRGFSFSRDEPLDMRMNPETGWTAAAVLNTYRRDELAAIFRDYGEERWANRITEAIVERRRKKRFERTCELAELVERVVPALRQPGRRRIHPATRVFQALRIFVNGELEQLERGLIAALAHLDLGGTLVVISFHSLEDRIVKWQFRAAAQAGEAMPEPLRSWRFQILTKRPRTPDEKEIARNPRSRSAKLRAIRRLSATRSATEEESDGYP